LQLSRANSSAHAELLSIEMRGSEGGKGGRDGNLAEVAALVHDTAQAIVLGGLAGARSVKTSLRRY
jgi:hypothetical protein